MTKTRKNWNVRTNNSRWFINPYHNSERFATIQFHYTHIHDAIKNIETETLKAGLQSNWRLFFITSYRSFEYMNLRNVDNNKMFDSKSRTTWIIGNDSGVHAISERKSTTAIFSKNEATKMWFILWIACGGSINRNQYDCVRATCLLSEPS